MVFSISYLTSGNPPGISYKLFLKIVQLFLLELHGEDKYFKVEVIGDSVKFLPVKMTETKKVELSHRQKFGKIITQLNFYSTRGYSIMNHRELDLFRKWIKDIDYTIPNIYRYKTVATYKEFKILACNMSSKYRTTAAYMLVDIIGYLFRASQEVINKVYKQFKLHLESTESNSVKNIDVACPVKKVSNHNLYWKEKESFPTITPENTESVLYWD